MSIQERLPSMVIVALTVGGASALVNSGVAAALGRFTNLTPSIRGALAAGGISGVSALGYVGAGPFLKFLEEEEVCGEDLAVWTTLIFMLSLPCIANAALTPNLSRLFPKCDVTWKGGLGYGALDGVVGILACYLISESSDKGKKIIDQATGSKPKVSA